MEKFSKPVMIKMKSIQDTDGESSEMELITEGNLSYDSGRYRVSYKDSEATGFENSVTSLEIEDQRFATITRDGDSPTNLVLEINKKHHCHYGTPYGDMMVGIYAHKIRNELSESGGSLYLKYTIDINSSYISDNEIILDINQK
ncbi:MAG: DUF1934 domain-containing protein [Oscillospiraceae bacterium]|nr:DUF1934 domain-containing protein [Oscillospiraceae bacterium]